ncbi:hypothetical protein Poli38472_010665 [Pythium oligandrum]|uniref:Nitroreductase domain-containing protein n=1 Tax=Pythium oligandrum TaxID=41045 RepID=A0A8K1FEE2_PYTOL|nr:hypothetical protein Poli38472_010665 [Pythium oligandrum]|eukprot:TMW55783.1 hypothetical protein Poli38472_010665 [Pythium oligandrum]
MSSTTSSTVLSVVAGAALASAAIFAVKKRSAPAKGEKKWTAEELIAARRSIFPPYDETRPVPREIIEKMLESANWAPTHGRTEPWRFVVFSSPEARRRLGELEAELYKKMVPANRFLEKKYKKKIQSKLESSYVIAICMKRQESEKLPEMEEICSVACAVQNMHLVATGHGVGAYWSSGPPIFSDEMKEFLGLGPKDKCIGLFYVGYPKGEIPTGARKPMAEKVTWVEK